MNFSKWAVVSYKDDTGLGRHAADVRSVLGIGRQLVVPSERLSGHPIEEPDEVLLDIAFSDEHVKLALTGIEGIIVLERGFHPRLMPIAKSLGLKIVCVPMWEWFMGTDSVWKFCDLFVCQSKFTESVVRQYGFQSTVHIPPAINLGRFPARQISGSGRLFIHNAGLVDHDDRKGTRDTIRAFKRVKRTDISLIVRMQKESTLPELDDRIKLIVGNLDDPAELYAQGDVAVQPSKMEGLGLTVLEPLCTGMPVITLDYPPMNEYVLTKELLVRKRWFKRRSFANQWIKHAHLRLPDIADLARKIEWAADNDLSAISLSNRQQAESNFSAVHLREKWSDALEKL